MLSALFSLSLILAVNAATPTYSATYLPSNVPATTEQGQAGTNRCGTALNQSSLCQDAYLNSLEDWCLWAPPEPGVQSTIGDTERVEVAWCIKSGTGARLIPDGAITGAHWVITPDYVQVTGIGKLTLLNIPDADEGGELDPHGADGNGNPIGGIVFSTAFGQLEQVFEWTNFMAFDQFCFRICDPKGPNAPGFCQHIYDVMGCEWNMPGNYDVGFDSCHADSGEPMGVYGTSTFHQGDPVTPDAHPAPSRTSCTTVTSIGNGFIIQGTNIVSPSTTDPSGNGASGPTSTGPSGGSASGTGPSGSQTSASGPTSTGPSGSSSFEISLTRSGSVSVSTGSGSGSSLSSAALTTGSTSSSSSSGAGRSATASIQGWERVALSLGSAVVFSLVGAAIVL